MKLLKAFTQALILTGLLLTIVTLCGSLVVAVCWLAVNNVTAFFTLIVAAVVILTSEIMNERE